MAQAIFPHMMRRPGCHNGQRRQDVSRMLLRIFFFFASASQAKGLLVFLITHICS